MGTGGRAATGQEHRHRCIGEQEPENGVGVAHQGGRVPGQRRVALYITAAVPPPVARIESTMMARQVRPTSPEPECVTGLQGRESDEEGDVRNPSGPGSARSHQEAGYMAAIDPPFLRSIHPLQTRGGPYMTHHDSACAPCGAELARHQVAMREANPPMSPKPATERARAASGTSKMHCHFCARPLSEFVRRQWRRPPLRRRTRIWR